MNKKADGKIISIYWFLILILVAGGIFAMVNIFYNKPYDIRNLEAEILAEKIANCISKGEQINPLLHSGGVFREDFRDNLFDKCSLTFEVQKEWQEPQYYVEVSFYELKNLRKQAFNITKGNFNWKLSDCGLKKEGYVNLVVCIEKEFYVMDQNKNTYLVNLISMVRKTEQNVKQS